MTRTAILGESFSALTLKQVPCGGLAWGWQPTKLTKQLQFSRQPAPRTWGWRGMRSIFRRTRRCVSRSWRARSPKPRGGPQAQKNGGRAGQTIARDCPPPSQFLVGHQGLEPADVTACSDKDLRQSPETGGAENGAVSADSSPPAPAKPEQSNGGGLEALAQAIRGLSPDAQAKLAAMLARGDGQKDGSR